MGVWEDDERWDEFGSTSSMIPEESSYGRLKALVFGPFGISTASSSALSKDPSDNLSWSSSNLLKETP